VGGGVIPSPKFTANMASRTAGTLNTISDRHVGPMGLDKDTRMRGVPGSRLRKGLEGSRASSF
jgi:hypothetical protein